VSARRPTAPVKRGGPAPAPTADNKPAVSKPSTGRVGARPEARPASGPQCKTPARKSAARRRAEEARAGFDRFSDAARGQGASLQSHTVRVFVLACVSMLAAVMLLPTVRAAVDQTAQLHTAARHLEANLAEVERLTGELDRWSDPAFIESQARSRLSYAMPGDQVWRAVGGQYPDGQTATLDISVLDVSELEISEDVPWFKILADSLQDADQAGDDELVEVTRPTPDVPERGGFGGTIH